MALLEFVSYLYGKGMIDAITLNDDSDEGFVNRLTVQNYAYLARCFGLDLGYWHDSADPSQYSSTMTRDCFALDLTKVALAPAPPGLREADFLAAVSGRSFDWLKVAAKTMRAIELGLNSTPDIIEGHVSGCEIEFVREVHADVHRLILPQSDA